MRTIGNFLWFICGGIFMGLAWWFWGLICFASVIGIPWGRSCFVLGRMAFFPFGKEAINRKELTGEGDVGTSAAGVIGNVLWFLFCGAWLALGHVAVAVWWFITILGIPFGIQHLKLAGLALAPIGKTVVSKEAAEEARGTNAEAFVAQARSRTSPAKDRAEHDLPLFDRDASKASHEAADAGPIPRVPDIPTVVEVAPAPSNIPEPVPVDTAPSPPTQYPAIARSSIRQWALGLAVALLVIVGVYWGFSKTATTGQPDAASARSSLPRPPASEPPQPAPSPEPAVTAQPAQSSNSAQQTVDTVRPSPPETHTDVTRHHQVKPRQPSPAPSAIPVAAISASIREGEGCIAQKRYDCAISSANAALRLDATDQRALALKQQAESAQKQALDSITIR